MMIARLLDRPTRPHRRHRQGLAARWRALDDDPLLLCGCEASLAGADCDC
jgi:hypothetical protein